MKQSIYKNKEELPMFLTVMDVAGLVKSAAEICSPSAQPEREIDYDYSELKERKNDFDYLSFHADFRDDPMLFYRLGRYYLEKTDDMENAEWWLRKAADRGLELASYLVYKGYRDGKFTEKPSDKLRKPGTGCVYQINDTLWEGSFYPRMPDGKRKKFNVYAETREQCEAKLAEMIAEKKAEIAEEKAKRKEGAD